mmetsp:Transcript_87666/g.246256  ORF Transcript_87666/g.246256 Transcript_87666/m.246256 type:complete len:456 (-) Transcript_87666:101-1468(-)
MSPARERSGSRRPTQPRMLRVEYKGQPYDWFNLDDLGELVQAPDFANTLRENIAHYFGVPFECQVVFDEAGILTSGVDYARALRSMKPCLEVCDMREMSPKVKEFVEQGLAGAAAEVARAQRMFRAFDTGSHPSYERHSGGQATPPGPPRGLFPQSLGAQHQGVAAQQCRGSSQQCAAAQQPGMAEQQAGMAAQLLGVTGQRHSNVGQQHNVLGQQVLPNGAGAPQQHLQDLAQQQLHPQQQHLQQPTQPQQPQLHGTTVSYFHPPGSGVPMVSPQVLPQPQVQPMQAQVKSHPQTSHLQGLVTPPQQPQQHPNQVGGPTFAAQSVGGGSVTPMIATPPQGGCANNMQGVVAANANVEVRDAVEVVLSKELRGDGDRAQRQLFGFANVPTADARSLLVSWIDQSGLLSQWNHSHSDKLVQEGDRILTVNGVGDDIEAMRAQLQLDTIRMMIVRQA